MLIIVPNLPPNINGLGDYAYCIAQKLKELNPLVEIRFLIARQTAYASANSIGFPVTVIQEETTSKLISMVTQELTSDNTVYLHYVGYGYEKRGTPLWLLNGLKKLKQEHEGLKLVTMFHELFATSNRPWQSSFWNGSLQQWICKKIYLLSDKVMTNREGFATVLRGFANKDLSVLPVVSNVGEPTVNTPLSSRKNQMVIFGSAYSRQFTYDNYHQDIETACRHFGIDVIVDIGKPLQVNPVFSTPFQSLGVLSANSISEILLDSAIGFIGFPDTEWFGKSGVFAALAAHGMLIIAGGITKETDGLKKGTHFLGAGNLVVNGEMQQVASNVWGWYQQHAATQHAAKLL